jgi:hypothetical protein
MVVNAIGWKSIYVPVPCNAGLSEVSIPYQEYLKGKCIKAIFQTGNSVGRNNQTIRKTDFWLDLKKGMDTYESFSANFLDFSANDNMIQVDYSNIDFQNSKLVFPVALPGNVLVELIVFYMDTVESPQ